MTKHPGLWSAKHHAGEVTQDDLPALLETLEVLWLAYAEVSRVAWEASDRANWGSDAMQSQLRKTLRATALGCACNPPESGGAWCTGHCRMRKPERGETP
jgi:hypothetical protein